LYIKNKEPSECWLNISEHKTSKTQFIWSKYGVAGLGALAPVLIGAHIGAAFAVALGAPPKKVMLWFAVGIAFWSVIATCLTGAGVLLYHQ